MVRDHQDSEFAEKLREEVQAVHLDIIGSGLLQAERRIVKGIPFDQADKRGPQS